MIQAHFQHFFWHLLPLNRSTAGLVKKHQIWNINEVKILKLETGGMMFV